MKKGVLIIDGDDTLWKTQEIYDSIKSGFQELLQKKNITNNYTITLLDKIDQERVKILNLDPKRFLESLLITYSYLSGEKNIRYSIEVESEIRKLYKQLFSKPELYPETIDFINSVKNNYELILYTSGEIDFQKKKILKLDEQLKKAFIRIKIIPIKSKEEFRKLLSTIDFNNDEIWVIGNSLKSDIKPALENNVKAIWINRGNWEYDKIELEENNFFKINSLKECLKIL